MPLRSGSGCARHGVPRSRVEQRWGEAEHAKAAPLAVCRCCSGPASVVVIGAWTTGGTVYSDPLCQLCREAEEAPDAAEGAEEPGDAAAAADQAGQATLGGEDWQ